MKFNPTLARAYAYDPTVSKIMAWSEVNEMRCDTVRAQSGQGARMLLSGPVGEDLFFEGITAQMVASALNEIGPVEDVDVLINSPGGVVDEGMSIYNLLKMSPNNITTNVIGEASSIASVVALAGDTIKMSPGSGMMIHRARGGVRNATEQDHRAAADALKIYNDRMVEIYSSRPNVDTETLGAKLDAETYMTAQQAVDAGFADYVAEYETPPQDTSTPTAMSLFFGQ